MDAPKVTTVDDLSKEIEQRVLAQVRQELRPLVGDHVASAMAVAESRSTALAQNLASEMQKFPALAAELRASVPQMPDFNPLIDTMHALMARPQADFSGLIKGMSDMMAMMREMCARMDKPVTRKGTATLPNGGSIDLTIVESKTR